MTPTTIPASGPVTIAGRVLTIEELPASAEYGLLQELRRGSKRAYGPGGYFARMAPVLAYLREKKLHAEHNQALAELTRLEATGVDPADDEADAYRRSPDGVACELFWRCRRSHPEVTQAELRAIITDANALDVHLQIRRVLAGDLGNDPTP
jgi:hypothetical protein